MSPKKSKGYELPKKGEKPTPAELAAATLYREWKSLSIQVRRTLQAAALYVNEGVGEPCVEPQRCLMTGGCGVVAGHGPIALDLFRILRKHGEVICKALSELVTGGNAPYFLAALIKSGELLEPEVREPQHNNTPAILVELLGIKRKNANPATPDEGES